MRISKLKRLICNKIVFEDFEDGKEISWMTKQLRSDLSKCKNIGDIFKVFSKRPHLGVVTLVEVLYDIISDIEEGNV